MIDNKGIAFSLNYGLMQCSNEIIVRMNPDDIMMPHRIKTQIEFMNDHTDCVMVGSNIEMFETDDKNFTF